MDLNKPKYLLIDGDYFLHRYLHQPTDKKKDKSEKPKMLLNTKTEMDNFKISVYNGIQSDFENCCGFFDDIIVVFDNDSWRKSVDAVRPYYLDELDATPLRYKANRDADKEKANVNFVNFYLAKAQIIEELNQNGVKVLCVKGCEGDDLLAYLANKNNDNLLVVRCSDGDMKYIVKDNVMLFRSIVSKVAPNGEFVISEKIFNNIFGKQDILAIFTNNTSTNQDNEKFRRLFQTDFNNKLNFISREPHKGVIKTERYIGLFLKCVCGDKKDNIFELFRWLSSTGNKWMKITELMIQKDFVKSFPNETYNDESVKRLFFDSENKAENLYKLFTSFITNKKELNKDIDINNIIEHFHHNVRLNMLEAENIPESVLEEIKIAVKSIGGLPKYGKLNIQPRQRTDAFKERMISNII